MESEPSDAYLAARAQDGYVDAFELLVKRYTPVAYRVALRLLANHHDAQDVAQESLLAAWRGLPRFRAESSFATWLYQIVTRRSLTKLTRGDRAPISEVPETQVDDTDGPADATTRRHTVDAVGFAVAALPPVQRVAIVLHHFEGLSYAEVAAVTSSTVPAVRSHLYRARRTLAAELGQWR